MTDLSVSVVTPSYNQAEFIRDTLDSVRNQTYDDVTHLVVDGESDDGTVDILREYDDLRWISEPDDGQADAINRGFDMATGDVVGWINSDDPYLYRDTVETVVETFERTDADVVYGHALLLDGANRFLRVLHVPEFDLAHVRRHNYLQQPSIFFRKEVLDEHRLEPTLEYSMDYELWLRLGERYAWERVDRVLAVDRNHAARKTVGEVGQSRQESIQLRTARGIYDEPLFGVRQFLNKVDWRIQRVRGLPYLFDLRRTPEEALATRVEWPPVHEAVYTQLLKRKQDLV